MPKIAFCGDSNMTTAYVTQAQLYTTLIAAGLGFTNSQSYAVSGQTSTQGKAQVTAAIAGGATEVWVDCITNDFSQGHDQPAEPIIAGALANYSWIIATCKTAGVRCVMQSPILPNTLAQVYRHLEFARRLDTLCQKEGVDYIPATEAMLRKFDGGDLTGWYANDGYGWHGSAVWHQFRADLVLTRQHSVAGVAPPVPPPSGVIFDLSCVGTNGSSTFTDTSSFQRAVTALGGAQIQSNAAVLDTAGKALQVADIAELAGAQDFSIRAGDVTFNGASGLIVQQRQGAGDYLALHTYGGNLLFQVIVGSVVTPILINAVAAWAPVLGTEYASIEVRRVSGVISLLVNDAVVGTPVNNAVALPNFAAPVTIGAASGGLNGKLRRLTISRA